MQFTFEQLPQAVSELHSKLVHIEQLLLRSGNTNVPEPDQLLTIEEAADLLKLAKPTVYGLVSKSEIPYSKKSKRLYFSKLELLDWVRTGRNKTSAETSAEATNYINRKRG